MRCVECQTDPLTPGHYCECCGRKLSVQERGGLETAPVTVTAGHHAPGHRAASVIPCESCGGPSADGELCRSCQQAFSSLLSTTLMAPAGDSVTPGAEAALIKASPSAELASSSRSTDVPHAASSAEVALPPPVVPEMAPASNGKSEAVKADTAKAIAASVVAARMAAAKSEKVHPAEASKPDVVGKRPIVSVPSHRRTRSMVLAAAAVVIAAAIGAPQGVRWLGIQRPPQTAREGQLEQPTPVAETVTVAERRATRPRTRSAAETATKDRESTPAPTRAAASARPKPTTTLARPPRVVSGPVEASRQPNPSTREVAPDFAPSLATEAPAPPPPAPVAAEQPRSIAATAPIGRFFEPTDVDESPRVATRVEPQLPADLPGGPPNDIVVVRVLVSQSGHPFRVSLLRGSKLGRSLDDAVVAAVTQWTFSPARKRGEAVSSWYNIGVPLGRAH